MDRLRLPDKVYDVQACGSYMQRNEMPLLGQGYVDQLEARA
jgi:hypothetical protein